MKEYTQYEHIIENVEKFIHDYGMILNGILKKYGGFFNILHIKGFAKITGDFPGNTILSDIENFRGDFRQRKPLALKII